jgi:threonine synthase
MTSITYSSTRGGQKKLDFRTAVMTGLAHDRGLFVPDSFPTVTKDELEGWRGLSYSDLATNVISKFVQEDQVPADKLADIIKRSCAAFRHEDVTPVIKVGDHAVLVSRKDYSVSNNIFANPHTLFEFLMGW